MTKDDAITLIKPFMLMMKNPQGEVISDAYYALDMAIQALKQEPCEDAISRQAVLDYIYNDLGLGDEENGKDLERQMDLEVSYKYVKSLPPVKPQICEDAINRQAVDTLVDELARAISDERCCISRGRSTATIMRDIYHLPSVKPQEPKTGHWIKMPLIEAGQTYSHECSLCGRRILTTNAGLSEFPYCHCGAKMD